MVISLSGKTGLSLTASGCMDSHRSTSSCKRSLNQSELLAGITNLEPSLSKRSSFSRAEEKLSDAVGVLRVVQLQTAAKTLAVIGSSAVKLDI